MNDFLLQVGLVVQAVPRLLAQMDPDPLSPTYGCAHAAYWRDKTSELADMRRQEFMLPLLWLYLEPFPDSPWQGQRAILAGVEALLAFWCRHRYADGSLDEWYVGERAFAAAAFTCHAVARTLADGAQVLEPALLQRAKTALHQTAHWLARRQDLFKANHQAVGVAALAWAGHVLQDAALTDNARHKLATLLTHQNQEGWFPEVGHMDVGYTFLTVEFVAMAQELWQEQPPLPALLRAFDFACQWIHPDLHVGEEYGVCHNPYLSRIAILYLSRHAPRAAWLRQRLTEAPREPLPATLVDDLRLPRWGFQPLLSWKLLAKIPPDPDLPPCPIPLADPTASQALHPFPLAGLVRLSVQGGHAILAPAAGGLLRLFSPQQEPLTDGGYALRLAHGFATNLTYHRALPWHMTGETIHLHAVLAPVCKFMPSFLSRLLLRLACTTATGSRISRQVIDFIRKRKGSALNQSAANLHAKRSPWRLERQVTVVAQGVDVTDHLSFATPVTGERLFFLTGGNTLERLPLPHGQEKIHALRICKHYRYNGQWQCTRVDANPNPPPEE